VLPFRDIQQDGALFVEPPMVSFLKSTLIGGGPVNAVVLHPNRKSAITGSSRGYY
jgi:hypothetical protein